jgi:hypothetical protein
VNESPVAAIFGFTGVFREHYAVRAFVQFMAYRNDGRRDAKVAVSAREPLKLVEKGGPGDYNHLLN